ncbi:hypothetical protein H4R33_005767 [Dimargaris cristalligena]|nr:hypothetical protein H4R33_005767 [Dimargaris cristalligena]
MCPVVPAFAAVVSDLRVQVTPSHSLYSCLACRKRRSGCNRQLPCCAACQKWATSCEYQLTPARLRKALARPPELEPLAKGDSCSTQPRPMAAKQLQETANTMVPLAIVTPTTPPAMGKTDLPVSTAWKGNSNSQSVPTYPVDDSISQITSRLLFKLMRNRWIPPRGVSYLDQIYHLANQDGANIPDNGPQYASEPPLALRTLVLPSDLLYHSSVIRHSIAYFGTFAHKGCSPLNTLRMLFRLDRGLIPQSFQLAAMLSVAPFSDHPVFDLVPPLTVSLAYYSRLLSMIPLCLVDPDPDTYLIIGILLKFSLDLGLFALHQNLTTAAIRKLQSARVYIMDHPNPLPRSAYAMAGNRDTEDIPYLKDEILREYYRIIWWANIKEDMLAALLYRHRPLIDLDACCVNLPRPDCDVESQLNIQLANPESDIFTRKGYPTVVNYTRLKNNVIVISVDIDILGHRVAKLRALQATDPAAWLNSLPGLNRELEQWYNWYTALARTDWQEAEGTSDLPTQVEASTYFFQVRVQCAMLIIYLNHFDGHSPDSTGPFPGMALASVLHTAGDLTGRTLSECHERCWTYAVRLRGLLIDSAIPPAFISSAILIASFYPAAVVCNERIHGMGSVYYTAVVSADRQHATRFIDEIIQVLDSFSGLWKATLKIADEIRILRNSPFTRRSLDIGHLI